VVGDQLFTISDLGVKANGLASFGERGWAAFPQPPVDDTPCGRPVPPPDTPTGQPEPSIPPCPMPMPID